MIDFDEIDVSQHLFTYFTEDMLNREYDVHKEKEKALWVLNHVKDYMQTGYRRFGEHEQEWSPLKYEIESLVSLCKNGQIEQQEALKKAYVLYDVGLILKYEGFDLQNNNK